MDSVISCLFLSCTCFSFLPSTDVSNLKVILEGRPVTELRDPDLDEIEEVNVNLHCNRKNCTFGDTLETNYLFIFFKTQKIQCLQHILQQICNRPICQKCYAIVESRYHNFVSLG